MFFIKSPLVGIVPSAARSSSPIVPEQKETFFPAVRSKEIQEQARNGIITRKMENDVELKHIECRDDWNNV